MVHPTMLSGTLEAGDSREVTIIPLRLYADSFDIHRGFIGLCYH